MAQVISPLPPADDDRYAIVVARYNESITRRLAAGAETTLREAGITDDRITLAWVPGAWEVIVAAQAFAQRADICAVITLGAVIRGETTHDKYLNQGVTAELAALSTRTSKPIAFGILTCESLEQALDRAGGRVGNKGTEAAAAAIEMVGLLKGIAQS